MLYIYTPILYIYISFVTACQLNETIFSGVLYCVYHIQPRLIIHIHKPRNKKFLKKNTIIGDAKKIQSVSDFGSNHSRGEY